MSVVQQTPQTLFHPCRSWPGSFRRRRERRRVQHRRYDPKSVVFDTPIAIGPGMSLAAKIRMVDNHQLTDTAVSSIVPRLSPRTTCMEVPGNEASCIMARI